MSRVILLLITLTFITSCATSTHNNSFQLKTASKITDFRGFKFNTSPLVKMVKNDSWDFYGIQANEYNQIKQYHLPGDKLQIGDISLRSISYAYFKNMLYEIVLAGEDNNRCTNSKQMRKIIEEKYETKLKVSYDPKYPFSYLARTDHSNLTIQIICLNNSFSVYISEPKLLEQANYYESKAIEAVKAKRIQKASEDL